MGARVPLPTWAAHAHPGDVVAGVGEDPWAEGRATHHWFVYDAV
jgi:NADPH-dependent ferric siderophore reductase